MYDKEYIEDVIMKIRTYEKIKAKFLEAAVMLHETEYLAGGIEDDIFCFSQQFKAEIEIFRKYLENASN